MSASATATHLDIVEANSAAFSSVASADSPAALAITPAALAYTPATSSVNSPVLLVSCPCPIPSSQMSAESLIPVVPQADMQQVSQLEQAAVNQWLQGTGIFVCNSVGSLVALDVQTCSKVIAL